MSYPTSAPDQSWSGQCPIHYTSYPCPICTSGGTTVPIAEPYYPAVPAPVYPDTYPPMPATAPPLIDPWMYPGYGSPLPPTPKYGFSFVPTACEHCFCNPAKDEYGDGILDHEECCNCGTRRLRAPFGGVEEGWEFEQGHWHHEAFDDD